MGKIKIKEKKPFQFTKKSIIALMFVSIAGIMTGIFVGGFFIGGPKVDYSAYSEAELRDKNVATLSQKAEGKLPTAFKSFEVFEIAEHRVFTHGTVYVLGTGKVDTIANQDVKSVKAYENGKYYKESISKGIKSVGERDYFEDGQTNIEYYSASGITGELTANWSAKKTRTVEEFSEENGVPITSFVPYIVSEKTLALEFVDKGVKEITLENGQKAYEFVIELDPILSVLNYVKQMKYISQLPNYPVFKSIKLTCVVDASFRFLTIDTYETYTVNYMGVNAGCVGTLLETFEYGKEDVIPVTIPK